MNIRIRKGNLVSLFFIAIILVVIAISLIYSNQRKTLKSRAQESIYAPDFDIGFNVTGIIHYGYELFPYSGSTDIDKILSEMKKMGAKVIRVSVANKNINDTEAARRLDQFLTKAASYDISAIVFFINLYEDSSFYPFGVGDYYSVEWNGTHILSHSFFDGGFRIRFKPFVQAVVAANKHHANIYAWEIGNELKDESSPQTFINFMNEMSAMIKNIDPVHAVSTGMINAAHTALSPSDLYPNFSNIDILTVHAYNGERTGLPDFNWAVAHGKKIILEEVSFEGTGDRSKLLADELEFWRSHGAWAFLHWGFLAKGMGDNGNGDRAYGMDTIWHVVDYDKLFVLYSQYGKFPPSPTQVPLATVTLAPTAIPSPTQVPAVCSGKFKSSNYIVNGINNKLLTFFDNAPASYGTAHNREYQPYELEGGVGKPPDSAGFKGGIYFKNGANHEEINHITEIHSRSVKLYYDADPGPEGWTIVKKMCNDFGSKNGCPDESELNSAPANLIKNIKVDCGVDVWYGWVLVRNKQLNTTITPTLAPTIPVPTAIPSSSPVPTGSQATSVTLNLKIRLQGITPEQISTGHLIEPQIRVRVGLGGGGLSQTIYKYVDFTVDENGVWSSLATFDNISPGGGYKILIKGPRHLQRRICDPNPAGDNPNPALGRYSCERPNIVLQPGENDFDFSNIYQFVGDVPLNGLQDGAINALDESAVIGLLGQTDQQALTMADFNADGQVNGVDYDLILGTLLLQNDEP